MSYKERVMKIIAGRKLWSTVEEQIRDDMIEVFNDHYDASDFMDEDYFLEQFIWNPDRWPKPVRDKVGKLTGQYPPE